MDNSKQYASMIAQLDTVLDVLREKWLQNRAEWRGQIDNLLDQRFTLMELRDGHNPINP